MSGATNRPGGDDLKRYLDANQLLENTRAQVDALEQSDAVGLFHQQLADVTQLDLFPVAAICQQRQSEDHHESEHKVNVFHTSSTH